MGSPKRWALTEGIDIQLWVTSTDLLSIKKYRLVHASGYFALNELPQATCLLAVGAPVPVDTLDSFGQTADKLRAMQPAMIVGKFSGDADAAGTQWPSSSTKEGLGGMSRSEQVVAVREAINSGYQVLFDGRLLGFNYQKINGQIFASIQLIHWLVDLANTSLLSQYVHPSGAANLAFPLSRPAVNAGNAAPKPVLVGQVGPNYLDVDQITTDVWGALKDFFYVYAGSQPMEFKGDFAVGLQAVLKNDLARIALARIEGGLGLSDEAKPGKFDYVYGKPGSPLQSTTPTGDLAVAGAISDTIRGQINQVYGAGTVWDHLVQEISPMFDLHVVPMIDRALVVPVTPGLSFKGNQTPWRTLTVEDYFSENMQAALHYPINAIVATNDRGRTATDGNIKYVSFNGVFQPTDLPEAVNGAIVFLDAPGWIQSIDGAAQRAFAPPGVQVGAPINMADAPQKPANAAAAGKVQVDLANAQFNYLNRWSQSMYVQRALAGRVGTAASRLRFDIAPGSTVRLQGSSDLFTDPTQDALAKDVYGLVVRTSFSIDAEASHASTVFQLSHVRSVGETQSGYCMDSHPLYNVRYLGAPLIPAFNL